MGRQVSLHVTDTITGHEWVSLKAREGARGERKPYLEHKQGESYSTERKRWMSLLRIVDHRNDRYRELVIDPETGEVVHSADELRSAHQVHGSASRTKACTRPTRARFRQ